MRLRHVALKESPLQVDGESLTEMYYIIYSICIYEFILVIFLAVHMRLYVVMV